MGRPIPVLLDFPQRRQGIDDMPLVGAGEDEMIQKPWYLASPYRKYPGGLNAAFDDVSRIAAAFTDAGVCVFSPIAHSHPISRFTTLDAKDPLWVTLNKPFMALCRGMIFCRMDGHQDSEGMAIEEDWFVRARRPVVYIDPHDMQEAIAMIKGIM